MDISRFEDISYEKDSNGIVTVNLIHPERKNAVSLMSFNEIWWAMDHFEKDEQARVMILTGMDDPNQTDPTKQAFCSGAYLGATQPDPDNPDHKDIDTTDMSQKRLSTKMWSVEKPIIAAINGMAIGGGFTLPYVGADLIYMADTAWIKLPFVSIAIVPEFSISYLLPRMIGFHKAKELLMMPREIRAQEACELGLCNKVFPKDQFMEEVMNVALQLIPPNSPTKSIIATKRSIQKPVEDEIACVHKWENEGLKITTASKDCIEAFVARKENRDPKFTGN